jgi:hypothetical protein
MTSTGGGRCLSAWAKAYEEAEYQVLNVALARVDADAAATQPDPPT